MLKNTISLIYYDAKEGIKINASDIQLDNILDHITFLALHVKTTTRVR